jgi:hypothetical protein
MTTVALSELLDRAGFRVRGRRADCIHCDGQSRLTVAFNDEVAFCHRCKWTANVRTLSRAIGLPVTPQTRLDREKLVRSAQFGSWVNTCHANIARHFRYLAGRAELAKRIVPQFPDCGPAWNALADFYHAEADLCGALDLLSFEKLSPWLGAPMTRDKLGCAFDNASERIGACNAA